MGKKLVTQMLPAINRINWTGEEEATAAGHQVFAVGVDQVDGFRGNPKLLGAALRTFQTANSLPFTYAGVAYTLVAASREADGSYDENGLQAALDWLEKAQELAPDIVDINFIEALVYVYGGRYQDARIVLDYLREAAFENYYLYRAEMAFWRRQGKLEEALEWSEKAMQAADTVPQRLRVKSRMGEMYLESGDEDKALETYREAIHFDPKNAELHHKASLIYWQRENYEEANRFNRKALSLQPDFPEAQQLRALLDEHVQSSGLMGRLFGS